MDIRNICKANTILVSSVVQYKLNGESQSVFKSKACGYETNADYNASINILHCGTTQNVLVNKSA